MAGEASVVVGAHRYRRPCAAHPAVALQHWAVQAPAAGVEAPVLAGTHLEVDGGLVLPVPLGRRPRGDLQHERRRRARVPDPVAEVLLDGPGVHAEGHEHVRDHELRVRCPAVVHVELLAHEAVRAPREVGAQGAVSEELGARVARGLTHVRGGGRVRHSRIHLGQNAHRRLPSRGPAAPAQRSSLTPPPCRRASRLP